MGGVCVKPGRRHDAKAPDGRAAASSSDEAQLPERSRRRLSLVHADPITHGSGEEEVLKGSLAASAPSMRRRDTLEAAVATDAGLSVVGAAAGRSQGDFENKTETISGRTESLTHLGIGHACKKGLKPESPNQDDFFIYQVDDYGLYGVFDGHGPWGHNISNFVQRRIANAIWQHEKFDADPQTALLDAFKAVQNDIEKADKNKEFDASLSGCTATVVIYDVKKAKLTTAHLGDSRAVLGSLGGKKALVARDLTEDHKPTLPQERARIEAAGGEVKRIEGDIPHRVFVKGKFYPGLAMSRAFGDLVATQAGVSSIPEVHTYDLNPERDVVLIICSDGVWEFISSQQACDMVQKHGVKGVQQASERLAQESWNRWIAEEKDVVDDITCQVIYLKSQ